ncbi:hypothetical protein L4174_017135 [Photobacterium sp. CCB-ST2H9]|uniref:hypothetical protein n=1 Tax=Photobacterium sp. CCB-ST2H9 TaxID=2912855 RepID=UPI0020064FAC|nr:hypothetical protein [Photobacterium sp. CCB-ST2H9]UTM59796.1 hypothetical protein L4174_017135 [Photobacterium sp. CCB-ST2H9]
MKINKIVVILMFLTSLSILFFWFFKYLSNKYEEEKDFNEQLSLLVESIEIKKWSTKLSPAYWEIKVYIPEHVEYEQWDQEYDMPRLLFRARKKGEKAYNIYSMNLNGTDIKLVATHKDFGGAFWPRRGINKPSRSPDGRFIITTLFNKGFWCTKFDIKEKISIRFAPHDCRVDYWSSDSKTALISNSGKSGFLDVDSNKIAFFEDQYGNDFEKGNGRLFTMGNGNKMFSKITEENNFTQKIKGDGKQVIYDMPGFKNPIRDNVLPEECADGGYYSADRKYFTCGYDEGNEKYPVYQMDNPKQRAFQSFGFWVIQPGQWAFQDERLYRVIRNNEQSVFKSIVYYYEISEEYEMLVYDDIYLSKDILDKFEQVDLTGYFPRLPTEEEYSEAYYKMKFGGRG